MSKETVNWYLDEDDKTIYCIGNQKRWDYSPMELVRILNGYESQLAELKAENLSLQEQSIRDNQNWIEETTNLQQQLKEKDEKIKEQEKHIVGQNVINNQLKNHLKEKDEEIAEQKKELQMQRNASNASVLHYKYLIKTNTKQVCEKIRNEFTEEYLPFYLDDTAIFRRDDLFKVLDQIEKGENND